MKMTATAVETSRYDKRIDITMSTSRGNTPAWEWIKQGGNVVTHIFIPTGQAVDDTYCAELLKELQKEGETDVVRCEFGVSELSDTGAQMINAADTLGAITPYSSLVIADFARSDDDKEEEERLFKLLKQQYDRRITSGRYQETSISKFEPLKAAETKADNV